MDESLEFRRIEDRCRELRAWIQTNAPQCETEDKHKIEGSEERGYWAHGYLTALLDITNLFSKGKWKSPGEKDARTRYAA